MNGRLARLRPILWGVALALGGFTAGLSVIDQPPAGPSVIADRSVLGVEEIDKVAAELGCEAVGRFGDPASDALTRLKACVTDLVRVLDDELSKSRQATALVSGALARAKRWESENARFYRHLSEAGLVVVTRGLSPDAPPRGDSGCP